MDNIFLVPMHGGIWTLCIDLTAREMNELAGHGFRAKVKCVSYLTESVEVLRREQLRYEYQHIDYQYSPHPNLSMHIFLTIHILLPPAPNGIFYLQECKIYLYHVR